jgi:hypothetical protein
VPASPWHAPQASASYALRPFAMLSGVAGIGWDTFTGTGASLAKRGENCFTYETRPRIWASFRIPRQPSIEVPGRPSAIARARSSSVGSEPEAVERNL